MGKFAFGHANENEIFVETEDGRAHIWYADVNGNVTGYTENVDNIAGTIIDAYNEHFGTDIQIWTPETKTLQVGDTVPNWNAYEKIKLPTPVPTIKFKMATSSNKFVGGLAGETLRIYAKYGSAIGINADGTFGSISAVGVPSNLVDAVNSQLGSSYTSYELDGNTGITSPIQDWDSYIDVNQ